MTEPKVLVRMEHIRAAKMCSGGTRSFFERHGLDWSAFLQDGIDAEKLLATGDGMAKQVVEVARGRKQ
ncbi:hypothetical protein P9A47_gp43 [Xanthomonas phage Elanor]|uniref:Tail assembly protein n=1 Tax=Xanthomonas phage Elanor TaxID=2939127 RepID=A0A9E7E186_9CAUD|nr:hypothetical protein P9A47_gp43 [Xanthomonas phage Elanor]URA07011.1 hypothetical protein Elanor_BL40043 [Xanthomonas phage Elanor]